ncbi:MAG TPA: hypothetical protein VLF87_00015 [Patescibacteria group bacterium]|nr:hypothetical protein [Patescibacteria group bacterium]
MGELQPDFTPPDIEQLELNRQALLTSRLRYLKWPTDRVVDRMEDRENDYLDAISVVVENFDVQNGLVDSVGFIANEQRQRLSPLFEKFRPPTARRQKARLAGGLGIVLIGGVVTFASGNDHLIRPAFTALGTIQGIRGLTGSMGIIELPAEQYITADLTASEVVAGQLDAERLVLESFSSSRNRNRLIFASAGGFTIVLTSFMNLFMNI